MPPRPRLHAHTSPETQLIGHRAALRKLPLQLAGCSTIFTRATNFRSPSDLDCIQRQRRASRRRFGLYANWARHLPGFVPASNEPLGRLRGSNMISLIRANFHLLPCTGHRSATRRKCWRRRRLACQPNDSQVERLPYCTSMPSASQDPAQDVHNALMKSSSRLSGCHRKFSVHSGSPQLHLSKSRWRERTSLTFGPSRPNSSRLNRRFIGLVSGNVDY